MNPSSSTKHTTAQTDQPIWVELSDDELSNVSGGIGASFDVGVGLPLLGKASVDGEINSHNANVDTGNPQPPPV